MKTKTLITNPIVKLLVYANVFISICAASQVLVTYLVFEIPVNFDSLSYIAFIFLSTYLQYNLQRGYMISQHNLNTERSQWLIKHKKKMLMSVGISLILVLFLCNSLSWTSIGIMVFAEVISSLYFLPPINLRKYGYFKPFIISVIWVVSCVIVPLIENKILNTQAFYFIGAQFLFVSVLCLLFDIKDASEDFLNGINTYANKFGNVFAKVMMFVLLLLMVVLTILYSQSLLIIIPQILIVVFSSVLVLFSNENKHQFFYYLFIDGLLLLQAVLFFIAYNYFSNIID